MLLEEPLQFFLERHLLVVVCLPLNVSRRVFNAGNPDAEGTIPLLPLEIPMLLERVVDPFRGIALEKLDGFRHGERGWNREEDVDMVFHTANDQRLHLVLARDAAEVWPQALLKVRLDERATLFGGPHAMHQATDEGVHKFWVRCILVFTAGSRIARLSYRGQSLLNAPGA
jgi:hypothetical protein